MELVHTDDFGYFLSFFDGVIANGTIIIEIIGEVGGNAYLIGFGVLFIEQTKVGVSKDEVEGEIQQCVVDGFGEKHIVIDVIVFLKQVQFFQEGDNNPNRKKVNIPAKKPRGFAYVNFNSLELAMLVLQQYQQRDVNYRQYDQRERRQLFSLSVTVYEQGYVARSD